MKLVRNIATLGQDGGRNLQGKEGLAWHLISRRLDNYCSLHMVSPGNTFVRRYWGSWEVMAALPVFIKRATK